MSYADPKKEKAKERKAQSFADAAARAPDDCPWRATLKGGPKVRPRGMPKRGTAWDSHKGEYVRDRGYPKISGRSSAEDRWEETLKGGSEEYNKPAGKRNPHGKRFDTRTGEFVVYPGDEVYLKEEEGRFERLREEVRALVAREGGGGGGGGGETAVAGKAEGEERSAAADMDTETSYSGGEYSSSPSPSPSSSTPAGGGEEET